MDTHSPDKQCADHARPGQLRSDSTPPRNGMHFYVYKVALDRGNVLRLVVEERVKTSAGSVHSATYRTDKAWKNGGQDADANGTLCDPRDEAKRYADRLNAQPAYLRQLPEGVMVAGVVRKTG